MRFSGVLGGDANGKFVKLLSVKDPDNLLTVVLPAPRVAMFNLREIYDEGPANKSSIPRVQSLSTGLEVTIRKKKIGIGCWAEISKG